MLIEDELDEPPDAEWEIRGRLIDWPAEYQETGGDGIGDAAHEEAVGAEVESRTKVAGILSTTAQAGQPRLRRFGSSTIATSGMPVLYRYAVHRHKEEAVISNAMLEMKSNLAKSKAAL